MTPAKATLGLYGATISDQARGRLDLILSIVRRDNRILLNAGTVSNPTINLSAAFEQVGSGKSLNIASDATQALYVYNGGNSKNQLGRVGAL